MPNYKLYLWGSWEPPLTLLLPFVEGTIVRSSLTTRCVVCILALCAVWPARSESTGWVPTWVLSADSLEWLSNTQSLWLNRTPYPFFSYHATCRRLGLFRGPIHLRSGYCAKPRWRRFRDHAVAINFDFSLSCTRSFVLRCLARISLLALEDQVKVVQVR